MYIIVLIAIRWKQYYSLIYLFVLLKVDFKDEINEKKNNFI